MAEIEQRKRVNAVNPEIHEELAGPRGMKFTVVAVHGVHSMGMIDYVIDKIKRDRDVVGTVKVLWKPEEDYFIPNDYKEEFKLHDVVERVGGGYIAGRTGKVVEAESIYDYSQKDSLIYRTKRARVLWTNEADGRPLQTRTWVNFKYLKLKYRNEN